MQILCLPDSVLFIPTSLGSISLGFLLGQFFLFIQISESGNPGVRVIGVVDQLPDPLHFLLLSFVPLDAVVLLDPTPLLAIGALLLVLLIQVRVLAPRVKLVPELVKSEKFLRVRVRDNYSSSNFS